MGVDGCGAPVAAISLSGLARAFTTLATADPETPEGLVAQANRTYPEFVGGTGRDVTRLIRGVPGIIAKDGAEGVYAAALPDGRAVALKIADGAERARPPVLAAALRCLGVEAAVLDELLEQSVVLGHGEPVGRVEPVDLARTPSVRSTPWTRAALSRAGRRPAGHPGRRSTVDGAVVGAIDRPGLAVLVGVTHDDGPARGEALARKVAGLRVLAGERSASTPGSGAGGQPVHAVRRHPQGPPSRAGPPPRPARSPSRSSRRWSRSCAPSASRSRPASSAPRCPSTWRWMGR